jgi:ADP-ribosylglycohydrolase
MHDVLNLCDLIPDEAEQLLHSGHPVERELHEARVAAAASDLPRLREIASALRAIQRSEEWPFVEPSDEQLLLGLANQAPRKPVEEFTLSSRIHGAWLGRCVANTLGKPTEGLSREEVKTYLVAAGQWPQTGYVPLLDPLPAGVSHLHESAPFATAGNFQDVPRDDDLDWTILGLAMLEEFGPAITTDDIARTWLNRLPFTQTYTAERIAYRNLVRGATSSNAAKLENPYREWIGALIRADIFGYVHPGDPAAAASAALVDARLSHLGNGIYGEMWAAALIAAAFATESAEDALRTALVVIPENSRLAVALCGVLDLHQAEASSFEVLAWVDENLGHYNWVHTINNAALISVGLLWGTDFISSVGLTISGGRDTDSSAATVGSVYGALHGLGSIPTKLVGATHVRVRSAVKDFDRVEIAELARRTLALAGAR